MNKKIFMVALLVVAMLATCTTISSAAKKHDGLTWRVVKTHGKYVTKFYANGELTAKVVTKKRLPVKVVASKDVTRKMLKHRKNKYILVEVIKGTCLNDYGDGKCEHGYYISYRCIENYAVGDCYRTYLIYENSKYIDDIKGRCDYMIGHSVMCPNCDGTLRQCPYWCNDHHMEPHEIQDFEIMEMGYSVNEVAAMSQEEKNTITPWFKLK